ncbi:uncharacterized protein FOMMEDRAFT_171430 [Fomitiporia mediterranea MF3/22]|uniref:uncharacterized protein n=1 Tax=Fomitiporia mediterranea (strain MF3/22) TaxID=694068 RepID=UPI0004408338|nr:uncharacterized protein FOMMEDRAFT_171430 [Fomitiporia mediterranea MF3/22]EJC98067.1 hypothetical protein FOMMEDRAFT_171430 [Fomitiporia mediterranea MF3/22]
MVVLAHDVYTDQSGTGPYIIFPTHGHQILSNCIHMFGVSILAYCFARRTENDRFTSWLWWSNLSWARLLIILIFFDSWFFLAVSGVLVNGVGLSLSVPVCSLGIFLCIFFYAGSKGLIYLFLVERVWVVASAGKSVTRMESKVYKGCAVVVFGYLGIVIVMILGRYADIRDDGVCIIGLHSFATIPLLTYDLIINILLTGMFVWFLYREQSISERLRRLARRTGLAALIALTTSCVNMLVLSLLHGKQLGWVCLSSCAADVMVNALVLFWVTGGASRDPYWHGAWENNKDGALFADPQELPPLNFPVSFVADPELGLGQSLARQASQPHSRTVERAAQTRLVVDLGKAPNRKASRESTTVNTRSRRKEGTGDINNHNTNSNDEDEDDKSVLEWDITESASGITHVDMDEKDMTTDKNTDVHPLRLTLDLEPPPSLFPEHSEPDSPATHETASSSARLTTTSSSTHHQHRYQYQYHKHPYHPHLQKSTKHRRRHWHARPRRAVARSRSRSRPRTASSPPASPFRSTPPPLPLPVPSPSPVQLQRLNSVTTSLSSQPLADLPPLPTRTLIPTSSLPTTAPLPLPVTHPPNARTQTPRTRISLRTYSDSFIRTSDLSTHPSSNVRMSQ